MDIYSEIILDHYKHPHNKGTLPTPTAEAEEHNPLCGDKIKIQLKLKNNVVVAATFTGSGCAISQASASMLTDKLIGKTIEEIETLTKDDILEMLHIEISPARLKCAMLALSSTKKALKNAKKI